MILVMAGWVFFRARSFDDLVAVFANLIGTSGYTLDVFWPLLAYAGPLALVEIYQRASKQLEVLTVGPFLLRYTATLVVLLAIMLFSVEGAQEFIYFDF